MLSENEGLVFPDGSPCLKMLGFCHFFGQNYGIEAHEHVKGNTVPILWFKIVMNWKLGQAYKQVKQDPV